MWGSFKKWNFFNIKAKIREIHFIFFWIRIHVGKYSLDIWIVYQNLTGNNIFIIGSIKAARKCVNREAGGEEKLPCFIGSFWGQERKEEGVEKGIFLDAAHWTNMAFCCAVLNVSLCYILQAYICHTYRKVAQSACYHFFFLFPNNKNTKL